MRDTAPSDYYLRIYSDSWVAQWPNPVGTTAWMRLHAQTLVWGYKLPLHDPTVTRLGPLLIMHVAPSTQTFERVRDLEPPATDKTSPADF